MEQKDYLEAHRYCANHRAALEHDRVCGCFHCRRIFSPEEITQWGRMKRPADPNRHGKTDRWLYDEEDTAFCPYCGVDAVLGESSGYPITEEFLTAMNRTWF